MRTAVLTAVLVLLLPPLANALNHPPVANAGEDQSIYNNSATCLDGSATDPDGESITDWLWVVESTPDGAVWGVGDPGRPFTCLLAYTPGI